MSEQDFSLLISKYHNWLISQFSKKYPELDQDGIFSEFYLRTSASILAAVEKYVLDIINGLSSGDINILPLEVVQYLCNKFNLTDTIINKNRVKIHFFVNRNFKKENIIEGKVFKGDKLNIIFEKWTDNEPLVIKDDIILITGLGKVHNALTQGYIPSGIKLLPGPFDRDISLILTATDYYLINFRKEEKLSYLLKSEADVLQLKKEILKKIAVNPDFLNIRMINDTIFIKTFYKITENYILCPVIDNIIDIPEDIHRFYYQIKNIGLDDINYFEDNFLNNRHLLKIDKNNYKNIPIHVITQPFFYEVYTVLKEKFNNYKIKPIKPILVNIELDCDKLPGWLKENIEFALANFFSLAGPLDIISNQDICSLLNTIQNIKIKNIKINYSIYTEDKGFVIINRDNNIFTMQDFNINYDEYSYFIGDIVYNE